MNKLFRPVIGLLVFAITLGVVFIAGPSHQAFAQDGCINEYLVYDGDTLSQIAKSFNVDMNELASANGISNPRLIFIGDVLCLDGLVEAQPVDGDNSTDDGEPTSDDGNGTDDGEPTSDGDGTTYVYYDPTLYVAGRTDFSITVNGIDYVTDNQGYFTVRRGDTLYAIALAFGVNQNDLMTLNGIGNGSLLFAGSRLFIPDVSASSPVPGDYPAIAIIPRIAGSGDTVLVEGYNYPANTDVDIYFQKDRENRISDVITTVTTDEFGEFSVEVEVISEWTNGDPLTSRTVSISGVSVVDAGIWAMNFFINTSYDH